VGLFYNAPKPTRASRSDSFTVIRGMYTDTYTVALNPIISECSHSVNVKFEEVEDVVTFTCVF